MAQRIRVNFLSGTASGVLASSSQTTITGIFPSTMTSIGAGQYIPIVLNPGYLGVANTSGPEIMYVTSASTTVISGTRAQEGSTLASGNMPWVAGPLVSDFTLSNGIINGDFPAPASSGQLFVSTSTTSGGFTNTLPSGTTVPSGVTIAAGVAIPVGNLSAGKLPTTVSGSKIFQAYNTISGNSCTVVVNGITGYNNYLITGQGDYVNPANNNALVTQTLTVNGSSGLSTSRSYPLSIGSQIGMTSTYASGISPSTTFSVSMLGTTVGGPGGNITQALTLIVMGFN